MPKNFDEYFLVQSKAKKVLDRIPEYISSESTELQLSELCSQLLNEEGITQTWYYRVPALVLLGSRSCLSVSGREYSPSVEKAGQFNLITIDLSPLISEFWGDCARSFMLENGVVTTKPKAQEFIDGKLTQEKLHSSFLELIQPQKTFEEVALEMNSMISKLGYKNLDFNGNLGHSIVKKREDRLYLEIGNKAKLEEVSYFTFEPHICCVSGIWGFKHENIYYFNQNGKATIL